MRSFRPFSELIFKPDPDAITVLLSPNGTGKTSLLEAVFALATASSFRTNSAGDMIKTGEHIAEVHGVLFQQDVYKRQMLGHIDFTDGNAERIGNFGGRPLLVHQEIENLVILRVKLSLDFFNGGIIQGLFPFGVPQCLQTFADSCLLYTSRCV